MAMKFGTADVHLIGKLFDIINTVRMSDYGFTAGEIRRSAWIFEDIDAHLDERIGLEWNNEEVE